MQEEVDPKVQFSPDSSKEAIDAFVSDFYTKNIAIMLAGEQHSLTYLGREYKDDLLVVYAELNPQQGKIRKPPNQCAVLGRFFTHSAKYFSY